MEIINYKTENSGERIDALLSHIVPELTRSAAFDELNCGGARQLRHNMTGQLSIG